jgi:hypothetical protein
MLDTPITILLVEDTAADAGLIHGGRRLAIQDGINLNVAIDSGTQRLNAA